MGRQLFDTGQTGIAISMVDLMLGLVLASVLGMAVVVVYRITHRGFHYERSFLITLVMMPPIVGIIMMLIGSNLALSLGMVGALSIIRFRTVIKDSRDMVYLFFTISVGLGCGTYNWIVTVVATLFLSALLFVLHFLQFGTAVHADFALVLSGKGIRPEPSMNETIRKHVSFLEVRSLNIDNDGWEVVYEVRFLKGRQLVDRDFLEELKKTYDVDRVSLLAPQLSLPL